MKKFALALTATLALGSLAACGGDSDAEAFCADQADLTSAFTGDGRVSEKLQDLKAPGDIKDEWATLLNSLENSTTMTAEEGEKAAAAAEKIATWVSDNC